ncbi:MAG: HD domain-containing phosphohydrolase [Gemmatimonadales bacterium]|nr:HD domain-containing phosphohydrolase [Gemmatimonadales bacterium]
MSALRRVLLHAAGWSPAPFAEVLRVAGIEPRPAAGAWQPVAGAVTLALADAAAWPSLAASGGLGQLRLVWVARTPEEDPPADALPLVLAIVPAPTTPAQLAVALRGAFGAEEAAARADAAEQEARARAHELDQLSEIGARLLTERDYHSLLTLILTQARSMTGADAGSLYLVESAEDGTRRLRFMLSQNRSRTDIPFASFTMPLDQRSLAGYAASSGEPLVLDDVYQLPEGAPYAFNRSFDQQYGYRTKSMLVVPMSNQRGEVTGVLQLINRKRGDAPLATPEEAEARCVPFDAQAVRLARGFAGQAAVSIENSQLYAEIERLLEGFVRAAVWAIEQRDPATAGHSERVTAMTVRLAEVVSEEVAQGPYGTLRFTPEQLRELRYAGLLHDFGKVSVREQVLVKAAKLYPEDLALIEARFQFLLRTAEWQFEKARAEYLEANGRLEYEGWLAEARQQLGDEQEALHAFLRTVRECNQPSVLVEPHGPKYQALREFAGRKYQDALGQEQPFLTPLEFAFLSIKRGTLNETERLEIESHAVHSYSFLTRIPWTKDLAAVPDIAHGHHEKLDGTGYPRGVRGEAIPPQTRMMTIADIFDALTASDRPYKRAMATSRALEILQEEANRGLVDAELFRIFCEHQVWKVAKPTTSHEMRAVTSGERPVSRG